MAKLTKNAKAISYLMAFFVFLAIEILVFPSAAWCDCTSCGDCAPPVIGFTSKQMSTNGNQNLTAIGGMGPYTWSLVSGGGNLPSSGTSVTYTAPSSNQNCGNNPTIRLTDSCGRAADLKIAANANLGNVNAYYVPFYTSSSGGCSWGINWNFYDCDGTYRYTDGSAGCTGGDFAGVSCCNDGCSPPPTCGCHAWWPCNECSYSCAQIMFTESNSCGQRLLLCADGVTPQHPKDCMVDQIYDLRECNGLTNQGCCPAIVFSCLNINSFSTDVSTMNLTSGQIANLTGTLPPNVGGTINWTIIAAGKILKTGSGSPGSSISASWDGTDASGKQVAPGSYDAKLYAGSSGGSCNDSNFKRTPITVTATEQDSCANLNF